MRQATLIVNPRAGVSRDLATLIPEMARTLQNHGIAAEARLTTGPGTAGLLAAEAAQAQNDIVFACGGDGTVHEVLQGLVTTSTALGVVPLGTANSLARNLKISRDPLGALTQQANAAAVRISVGRASYLTGASPRQQASRYFTVIAGAGPDGALVYSLLTGQKKALGRTAYYAHAARLFFTRSFPVFRISYRLFGSALWQEDAAVSAMCARVDDLGGLFSRLTRGASIHSPKLRLSYLRPPARISLPSWFASAQLGAQRINPWLSTIEVEEFRCEPLGHDRRVHAQVDGEWIGGLPLAVAILSGMLSIVVPETG